MLMDCKSQIEAMRSFAFYTATQLDRSHRSPDAGARAEAQTLVEFFTPIVKAWSTEVSSELTSEALQCFGGMGYVEETGVAQYLRDVRITQIYEGTTGIQAMDLLGRKFLKDMGKTALNVFGHMQTTLKEAAASENEHVKAIGIEFEKGLKALQATSLWIGGNALKDPRGTFAGSVPYLMMWGYVAGAWMMTKSALIAAGKLDDPFYAAKLTTARYYADHVAPKALAYQHEITKGGPSTLALPEEHFDLDRKSLALA
jgi:hypothetical protein